MPDLSHIERLGAERRRAAHALGVASSDLRLETVDMYREGARKLELARAAGVSRTTLDKWLNRTEER